MLHTRATPASVFWTVISTLRTRATRRAHGRDRKQARSPSLREAGALFAADRRRDQQICALTSYETDDHQQDDGADHGVDDRADEAGERQETQLPEQPDADEGADDTEDDVPEQSESKPAHDLPGQPAGDGADDQHDDDAVDVDHDILPPRRDEHPAAILRHNLGSVTQIEQSVSRGRASPPDRAEPSDSINRL